MDERRSILKLSNEEAKAFFLKYESYNNHDLLLYFVFDELLKTIDEIIVNKNLSS